ncbi:hypothetical protein ONZ45_g12483 [Pleurotus djamor]|nr:hypothetical protein ONZ45_g12483 [Pleurotus djamor]
MSNLPPEILLWIFRYLSDKTTYNNLLSICHVCKAWLPSVRAALYRSVALYNSQIDQFDHTIEEGESLVPLIRHLTIYRIHTTSDLFSVAAILEALSRHETLLSFHLYDMPDDDLAFACAPDFKAFSIDLNAEMIGSLSFLRHLDVHINAFENLPKMKGFISSFPHLHSLEVNDAFSGDLMKAWHKGSTFDVSPQFPMTIRALSLRLSGWKTLKALFEWVLQSFRQNASICIQHFSTTVIDELDGELLGTLLKAFGAELKSLRLEFRWPSELPVIDLSANVNLRALSHDLVRSNPDDLMRFSQDGPDQMGCYLSNTLAPVSLSSLQSVEFDLLMDCPIPRPRPAPYLFIDWGFLDQALGNTNIRISVVSRIKEALPGVEEDIIERLPRHRAQGTVQCIVSLVYE